MPRMNVMDAVVGVMEDEGVEVASMVKELLHLPTHQGFVLFRGHAYILQTNPLQLKRVIPFHHKHNATNPSSGRTSGNHPF